MNQGKETHVNQLVKINRKLPPHELNARRDRKRNITRLPSVASLPSASELLSTTPLQKAKS